MLYHTGMELREHILKLASEKRKIRTVDVVISIRSSKSRQFVSLVINGLVHEGLLIKGGSTKSSFYALPENAEALGTVIKKRLRNKNLKEHEVLDDIQYQTSFMEDLKENISSIFTYAFSEMLNNAIEHSRSENIEVEVEKKGENLEFTVNDFGIGVFRNVMEKRGLDSELEAIQDLMKGKTTTQPQAHSGEGIFFTSKIADVFILESFGYRLRIDNVIDDIFVEEQNPSKKGTRVLFTINIQSKKHLSDLFKKYQTDSENMAFDKTEIKIKLYTMGTIHISRSQARRALTGLEKFKTIILDFDKVPTVGQAFADEIFRVFKTKHPEITINPVNMNEAVEFMISRVEKS